MTNIFHRTKVTAGGGWAAAENSWTSLAQWGTNNAVFVENNAFYMNFDTSTTWNSIDGNSGSRMVIRYNDFYDARVEGHSAIDTSTRGVRSYEAYNNVFNKSTSQWYPAFSLRAGSHVITRNHLAGNFDPPQMVKLDNRRSFFDAYATKNSQCIAAGNPSSCCTGASIGNCSLSEASWGNGLGDCNGTGSLSLAYDTFDTKPAHLGTIGTMNLLCLDQPGAGTGTVGSQTQDPIYVWGNTYGKMCLGGSNHYKTCTSNIDCPGSTCSATTLYPNSVYLHNNSNNQPYQIVAGRDYKENTARPGWSAYPCPHFLAGAGTCTPNIAGRAGYTHQ